MSLIMDIRQRHVSLMQKTCQTLGNVLKQVSQEQATTLRDGSDGWTIVEVVCHLRDFDEFFYGRAVMMREQSQPDLPGYDHEALAIEREYNKENLQSVYKSLVQSRERFVAFFNSLSEAEWECAGNHPERDRFTMTDSVMQVGGHDVTHIEQITRILNEGVVA